MTIWDDRYCTDAAPTNSTSKQAAVMRLARAEGLVEVRHAPFDADATWADIATVHDRAYVEAVRTGSPRRLAESQGFRWSTAQADAVARIWNGHTAACRLAAAAGLVLHPVSGAHHAGAAEGSGFCTFNFLSGAARAVLREGLRLVAIVDLDVHQGDGTYELEAGNPGVALFDIAGSRWADVSSDDRVEYRIVGDAESYREALRRLPAFLDRLHPDLVQYQAGMDPFEHDPIGGLDGVSEAFLTWRDAFVIGQVRRRGIPLVVNLAGGYSAGVSERLHLNTVRVMAGRSGKDAAAARPSAAGSPERTET